MIKYKYERKKKTITKRIIKNNNTSEEVKGIIVSKWKRRRETKSEHQ